MNAPAPNQDKDSRSRAGQLPVRAGYLENLATIPPRRRVLGWSLMRGEVTLLVAPPGVGKSTLGLLRAVAICAGRVLTGETVHESGKVWLYNNEDTLDELKRRLAAVLQYHDIDFTRVQSRLALSSGAERPLLLARGGDRSGVVRLPDVDACIAEIQREGFAVFIADPFAEMHDVLENSNEQIKRVAQMFREIAWRGDCAVLLVHHTAKPPQGSSDGHAGNMHSARGASALTGVARVVQTIFSMSGRDAQRLGISEDDKHLYVRLDDAKANLSLVTGRALWFKRVGVTIPNGDEVGILQPVELGRSVYEPPAESALHQAIMAALLNDIPERQISLNAAARQLAWSEREAFHRYRETDARGYRRASRLLRDAIASACRARVTVASGRDALGFLLVENSQPLQLRRFAVPLEPKLHLEDVDDDT